MCVHFLKWNGYKFFLFLGIFYFSDFLVSVHICIAFRCENGFHCFLQQLAIESYYLFD